MLARDPTALKIPYWAPFQSSISHPGILLMSDYAAKKKKDHLAICLHLPKTLLRVFSLPDAFCFTCYTSRRVSVREVASDGGRNRQLDIIKELF